ncbi:cytochrome P450 [Auriculariales sp. MPI-PUGE-AT-0066]|nr:cytochrome P450 [Auriculariales sp. MPI-PUGE-AT-0066]
MDRLFQIDVVVSGVLVLLTILTGRIVWNITLSPLARQRIPGPAAAVATELWYQWHGVRMDRTMAIDKLFKTYGPVVRIGPNRVAFIDSEAVHKLHRLLPFNKAEFLTKMTFGGGPNTASTSDPTLHAKFRRWHAPALRGVRLRETAVILVQQMEDLISRLTADGSQAGGIDVLHLMNLHTLDMLGLALFDAKFDQVKTGRELPFVKDSADWLLDFLTRTSLPPAIYGMLKLIPLKRLREIFSADDSICQFAAKLYDETPDKPTGSENINMIAAGKWYRDPVTGEAPTKQEVISDMGIFLVAGTDTNAIALTFACYHLARQPRLYENLRDELRSANMLDNPYEIDVLRELPYLNAFVKEVLRSHSPAGLFERVVPKGGIVLAGYTLPEGTVVGASAYTSGLREDLFPDAKTVNPERWLMNVNGMWIQRHDIPLDEMNAACHPFSLGLRACPGRPLAEIETVLTITTVVRNFRVRLHESTTEDSMSPVDLGVIPPKAHRCLLHFELNPL